MTAKGFRAVKGTRDVFPPESEIYAAVEKTARDVFSSYGYGEVRTPVLESTELFARSVGETTDIVHKEMYTFPDRKGRSLTMRPASGTRESSSATSGPRRGATGSFARSARKWWGSRAAPQTSRC